MSNDRRLSRVALLSLLASFFLVLAGCSTAQIRVLDQNGNPIEGVLVRSNIQPGNAYFSSDETTVKYTDDDGKVTLPVGKWFRLTLVEKEGYQFRTNAQFKRQYGRYMFGRYAEKFTADSPLIIRGWKRGAQPALTYVGGTAYFPDNVEYCTLELVQPTPENGLREPVVWKIHMESDFNEIKDTINPEQQYKAHQWRSWMRISGAELQGTRDLFMNEAPAQGYEREVEWGPFVYGEKPPGIEDEEQNVFIRGEDGQFYGGGLLLMWPDSGTKAKLTEVNNHGVSFQFWFNFNGSVNVMRRPDQTVWSHLSYPLDQRVYCREAPRTYNF